METRTDGNEPFKVIDEDLLKEIVRPIIIYAYTNPDRYKDKVHYLCGTKFDFSNQKKIHINDKKKDINFEVVFNKDKTDFEIIGFRNGNKKLKKLLNCSRWKHAIEGIGKILEEQAEKESEQE